MRIDKMREYPIGSISSGTMRPEDLIPTFCRELDNLARQSGLVDRKTRADHRKLVREIEHSDGINDFGDEWLSELFDALECYSGPYFYFGAHPGDGADYGWWLGEDWDADFRTLSTINTQHDCAVSFGDSLKVSDLADVPSWFRGEVAEVNDHGNVTLYVKTSRGLREVWGIV